MAACLATGFLTGNHSHGIAATTGALNLGLIDAAVPRRVLRRAMVLVDGSGVRDLRWPRAGLRHLVGLARLAPAKQLYRVAEAGLALEAVTRTGQRINVSTDVTQDLSDQFDAVSERLRGAQPVATTSRMDFTEITRCDPALRRLACATSAPTEASTRLTG